MRAKRYEAGKVDMEKDSEDEAKKVLRIKRN